MLSTLLANGMNMIWQGHETTWTEPIASTIATIFSFMPPTAAAVVFFIGLVDSFTNLTDIPRLRAAIKTCALNRRTCQYVYFHRLDNAGRLKPIDFEALEDVEEEEEMPALGVGKITDFTQLQMIDLYACVECGRCTNMCPATGTGKMLSPMDLNYETT